MNSHSGDLEIITAFTPAELVGLELRDTTAIVIDVLRGSTTLIRALKNGALKIMPVAEIEAAKQKAAKLHPDEYLLCGERNGLRVEGFQLGNSPSEYAPDIVRGKELIYSSTNCSKALLASMEAARALIGSFNNISAVLDSIELHGRIVLICSGKMGRFALEDSVCAGMFINEILKRSKTELAVNDASRTAKYLFDSYHRDILLMLKESSHGYYLSQLGMEHDLEQAALINSERVVPELSLDKAHFFKTIAPFIREEDPDDSEFQKLAKSTWKSVLNI